MQQVSRTALPNRLQGACVDYLGGGAWRLWMHTNDHVYGTYLVLYNNGKIVRVTTRVDEGDDVVVVKPGE